MRIIALALMLVSFPAWAQTWLTVGCCSYHFDKREGKSSYEQTNPGLGLEHAISPRLSLAAGLYRNSIRSDSGYFGVAYFPFGGPALRLGTSVGVVSGYEGNLIPIVVPTAAWEGKSLGLNVLLVPPYQGKSGGLGFQIKFRL